MLKSKEWEIHCQFLAGDCCLEERRGPHSRCKCDHRTPGCYEDPYKPVGKEVKEWDCCESREPEFLEDHVRCYHPRLAPKPKWLPKGWPGQANRNAQLQYGYAMSMSMATAWSPLAYNFFQQTFSTLNQISMDYPTFWRPVCMSMYRSIDIRPVGSGGGFGVGLQSGLKGTGKRRGRSKSPKSVQGCSAGPPPLGRYLPASARYGYYRYYGEHRQHQPSQNYTMLAPSSRTGSWAWILSYSFARALGTWHFGFLSVQELLAKVPKRRETTLLGPRPADEWTECRRSVSVVDGLYRIWLIVRRRKRIVLQFMFLILEVGS